MTDKANGKLLEEVGRHWTGFWNLNIKGDSTCQAPNLPLDAVLKIFVEQELEFYCTDLEDRHELLTTLGLVMAGVSRTETHSRNALQGAFEKLKQVPEKASRNRISAAWRLPSALAAIWVTGVLLYAIAFHDFGHYSTETEVWTFTKLALTPAAFGLFSTWLLRKTR